MEMHGVFRRLVKAGDQVTARLDTHCYADSFSQLEFLLAEKVVLPQHITVIGSGSLAGVDLARFDPEAWQPHRKSILSELGIAPDTKVICFIGRLTRDKGIEELVTAFDSLRAGGMKCVLLLVGPQESDWGSLSPAVRQSIENDTNIRSIGYSSEPERYLAVTDIFCLPSYREGFGNVVIEAAAMGVATVGTDIVGLRDAVVDGETGLLVPPKDAGALAAALALLLTDDAQRVRMGRKAYARVSAEFDAHLVNAAVVAEYQKLWAGTGKAKSKPC
jgi:glycosyltransferase involved in cell wall biosynthesis